MMLRTTILLGLGVLPLLAASDAESAHRQKPRREAAIDRPLKDCHRYNAWYGFYGNIWCTPAEQDRWDRREAARLKTR